MMVHNVCIRITRVGYLFPNALCKDEMSSNHTVQTIVRHPDVYSERNLPPSHSGIYSRICFVRALCSNGQCSIHFRGMLDFVRRRKLIRIAIFRPDHFLPLEVYAKCDFCDSNVVKMLSVRCSCRECCSTLASSHSARSLSLAKKGAMLDALALATLFAHGPKGNLTDAQVLPLKSKLIDSLSIGANCSYGATENDDYDPWEDLTKIKDRLCAFAETCVGRPGPVAQLLNPDVHQNVINAMPARRREMVRYLNDRERTNLAQLLIKDADRYTFRFHCRYSSCACAGESNSDGDDEENLCEFRFIQCPNRNCNESFSFKHQAEHDEGCGFKCVPCPSECGERIPRNEMHIHVRDRCILRRAECPLSVVGCTATVRAGDIPAHLKDHADQHFVLIAHRMMEYQSVMKDMNARIRALEERNGRLERELQEATSQLQSKNDAKATLNNVKKLTKRLATMEAMCRKEFRKTEEDRKRRN